MKRVIYVYYIIKISDLEDCAGGLSALVLLLAEIDASLIVVAASLLEFYKDKRLCCHTGLVGFDISSELQGKAATPLVSCSDDVTVCHECTVKMSVDFTVKNCQTMTVKDSKL